MTRTVTDAAVLLNVMDFADGEDASMKGKREKVDYTIFLKADGLRDARIGVARDYWGRNAVVDTVTDAALEAMKKAGAELIDIKFPDLRKFGDAEFFVLQYEFKDGLEKYLTKSEVRGIKLSTT